MPASAPVSLTASGVGVARAERSVLVDVSVTVTERSRVAVVGPNGVGKSTLLSVLAGDRVPDTGTVTRTPADARVGLMAQEIDRIGGGTVRALLARATGVTAAETELTASATALATDTETAADRYDLALAGWTAVGAADFDSRVESVVDELGLSRRCLDLDPAMLSGGEAGRVGLARILLTRFDIVLLDEPTNDLDLDGLATLERWMETHPGGVVVVSHDRAFLERTVTSVFEIDEHTHTASIFDGGWQTYRTEQATLRRRAEERYAGYVAERDRLRSREQRQREWADQGTSRARGNPADGDKFIRHHNVSQSEKLAGKAKATQRARERLDVVERPWQGWDLRFDIATSERSGAVVATLDEAVLQRGDFVLGPLAVDIRYGERIAVRGPNGSGKTTLIEALLGRIVPTEGRARLGTQIRIGELDQRRESLQRPGTTLLGAFEDETDRHGDDSRSILAKFGLDHEAVLRPAATLSPGERTRAQLAAFQARGVNLLVLDEPTNHLDLPAIEQLESALESYTGTLLVVTHDRRFADNLRIDRTIDLGPDAPERDRPRP